MALSWKHVVIDVDFNLFYSQAHESVIVDLAERGRSHREYWKNKENEKKITQVN